MRLGKHWSEAAALLLALLFAACAGRQQTAVKDGGIPTASAETEGSTAIVSTPESIIPEQGEAEMQLKIGDTVVSVAWEQNESVEALTALAADAPLTIRMSMYGGFEQVGPIGRSLPRNDVQTMTDAGDIVLYAGNQLVLFYGSNSWAYTRLGRITDRNAEQLRALLGNGDVTVTIFKER